MPKKIIGYNNDMTPVYAEDTATEPTFMSKAVDWLPVAGGTVGGIVGGLGGTAFGFGIGGVPGAVGGAAVGGAGGEAAKQLIERAMGEPTPRTSLGAVANIGKEAVVQGGSELLGRGVGVLAKNLGPAMMQSALKPGIKSTFAAMKRGAQIPPVVQTLLDEGVNVTRGGIEKLNKIISATSSEVKNAIAGLSSAPSISPLRVAGRLNQTARKFGNQVAPQADLSAVSSVGEDFLAAHGARDLSVQAAQKLKTGTYEALGQRAYGEVKGATTEAEKALARGLREEIEAEASRSGIDISSVNLREGKALDALGVVARRVAIAGNNNPLGLAGLAVSHPATLLTMLVDRSGAVKSLIARGLYSQAGRMAGISPALIRTAVQTLAVSEDSPGAVPSASLSATISPTPAASAAIAKVGQTKYYQGKPYRVVGVGADGQVDIEEIRQ